MIVTTTNDHMNGRGATPHLNRAQELDQLLLAVRGLILPFVKAADDAAAHRESGRLPLDANGTPQSVLVDAIEPHILAARLKFLLPDKAQGKEGLLEAIAKVLRYSVNTWDQGFLDKLYSSNNPVGVVSDVVLSVLNTNLHVYQVSPALTIVEKTTGRALANKFGLTGPRAGGVTCQGGSSSNLTSLVVARNTLYPDCKTEGDAKYDFVVFTSAHGHYSVEKSAMICGMGSSNVWKVPVDDGGSMKTDALRELVIRAKEQGKTPLYVNTTAGSTVRGSFDPFEDIAKVCKEFRLWMHIDASWGGPVVFSARQRCKLKGSHLADSITINPHKMLNAPTTCSFLLGPDMSIFNRANTTDAGYLFHGNTEDDFWDLADLTLQCGRRGDSLKLALAWLYYGASGFERQVDDAFHMASYLWKLVQQTGNFAMVSENPPPCLQVCFYHAPNGQLSSDAATNTNRTRVLVEKLIGRGFMVDYAPGDVGSFLRIVVNVQTLPSTVEGLTRALDEAGKELA
ncbi:Pyridoxal phosphate-dependent decarboxylase [Metarhizium album ARSEF 1941]|uniref:Pyridoxal phosphate-dependent decarboxylase n=1 Tax=Metarhizium album (strain ARSEF 1941) TaxID=1081103 RepID=A0A0B2WK26_METAS|nr:Pyridoxal phosphate-dependent decarboxylase [Metarhizium album ARSEF 1941]KHN93817.1 Pyridoxal phosphate-dependent decarboxylase [Metarhizium album ARSEF 1941]